ncbi:MAG: MoxR family ATPase [Planctomycetota bacterium]|nr:MoxR family ATPase [Planctomycetota bacterium]
MASSTSTTNQTNHLTAGSNHTGANQTGLSNIDLSDNDVQAIDRLQELYARLRKELGRVIIGQHDTIERLCICLFARGHALLMGVPGLAKTLLVSKLAETMSLNFSRIQFTPDLMPMDITGTDILQDSADGRREFQFIRGPVFANIVLADEINRAPPKTQAAMLEAMQEQKVTVVGKTSHLEPPFFVLATQNPVEQEGTYPLPEAQLDRFMFLIELDYPSEEEEIMIARTTTGDKLPDLAHLLSATEIIDHQHLVRRVPVPDHIYQYAVKLVRKTRPQNPTAPAWLKPFVAWGAGPRAVQYLILGAKARAALHGSYMVRLDDIHEVAIPVLAHRLVTTFAAQAEGLDAQKIVRRLITETIEER